jgi:hypothetical protein
MEFRIVPIALTWSMDDETVNRFFPCSLVFNDRSAPSPARPFIETPSFVAILSALLRA